MTEPVPETAPEGTPDSSGGQALAMRGLSLGSGLLFGAGLLVSGMTRPEKVLGFLDVSGDWDPSLAFVMIGAISVYAIAAAVARSAAGPWWAVAFQWPTRVHIDAPLVIGSAMFGVGWGLVGYCPGPALGGLGAGSISAAWFAAAMLIGMLAHRMTRPGLYA